MEVEIASRFQTPSPLPKTRAQSQFPWTKIAAAIFFLTPLSLIIFSRPQRWSWSTQFYSQILYPNFTDLQESNNLYISRLRDSVEFLPLKDLRFSHSASIGHTWFMSGLNDTLEGDEVEHLYFPSRDSNHRMLCLKGRDEHDGSKNSYALAWRESLPEGAVVLEGLSFVSDTYYDYGNLWHAISAMSPFVSWSMRNGCVRPARWILYHWGELRNGMGAWVANVMEANFGEVKVEAFENGTNDGVYCFEKALVMRHNLGRLGRERKLMIFEQLRCKARKFCGVEHGGRWNETDQRGGKPVIRLTMLMRRNSRSFKNGTLVTSIFARECKKVDGCFLNIAQSENLTFCDQVRVMTNTDIVASPHGAQLTNMLFMDQNSSVMEFFPRGWFELAGVGQYAHHWMADWSGMKHRGSWWEPLGTHDCPDLKNTAECFHFYKDGKVGHNETYFADWARDVINQVRLSKIEQLSSKHSTPNSDLHSNSCQC